MSHELSYFLKVNIAIILFYAFYKLFFYKDTFFQWRRVALLSFLGVALLYPFLNVQEWVREQEPMVAIADLYATVILPESSAGMTAESGISLQHLIFSSLKYLYAGVALLLLARFFFQLFGIFRLVLSSHTRMLRQTRIYALNHSQGTFSFFQWIFICPEAHSGEEIDEILTHELTHSRQWHSVDVLFSQLVCVLCWFNPFVWLIRREILCNLEFLADHNVLQNGHDSKTYQYHLLNLTYKKKVATLYNNFNVLPLKKRIKMMNKKRTKQIGRTKYLIFLPLAVLLLITSNIEAIARSTKNLIERVAQPPASAVATETVTEVTLPAAAEMPQPGEKHSTAIVDSLKKPTESTTPGSEVVFEVVEKMPEYPGGNAALMKFISDNFKYPENAVKNKISGRVIVQFVIDKEGNATNPVVIRSIDPELDAEALRVVSLMPKWTPGMQRGVVVAVRYTVPFAFRLPDDDSAEKAVVADDETVYSVVDKMPEFAGKDPKALMEYLSKNVQYPKDAQAEKAQGRVIVQFVVDKEGNVTNPRIVRSAHPSLDQEAIRLISNMPKWTPGQMKGQAVSTKYTVPISFTLPDNKQ